MSAKKSTTGKRKRVSVPKKNAPQLVVTRDVGDILDSGPPLRREDLDAKQAAYETSEKWVEFARERLAAGREIPIMDIPEAAGELGRASAARTDELYRRATRTYFSVPALPWKEPKD